LTVLAGAGADFLKIALTVTAIVCFLLNVDEKRVRYMKITDERFWKMFHSPNFYLEDTKFFFSKIFLASKRVAVAPRAFVIFFARAISLGKNSTKIWTECSRKRVPPKKEKEVRKY
jgi:hypothetical protein